MKSAFVLSDRTLHSKKSGVILDHAKENINMTYFKFDGEKISIRHETKISDVKIMKTSEETIDASGTVTSTNGTFEADGKDLQNLMRVYQKNMQAALRPDRR